MRCFYILIHGTLNWRAEAADEAPFRPAGFYCHRYVLAAATGEAAAKAFRRVRRNLDRQTGWLTGNLATVDLEAEKTSPAPLRKLLAKENLGHTFYERD